MTGTLSGSTPLCSSCGNIENVGSLVNHGADFNAQDKSGRTPLHSAVTPRASRPLHAADLGMVEIGDFLLKAGADETVGDNSGKTALMRSMERSGEDALDHFIHARARAPS